MYILVPEGFPRVLAPPGRGERDRFRPPGHARMPPAVPAWASALASVNFCRPVKAQWGYWVPEAALVVLPDNVARLGGYVANWLQAKEPWLYILANRASDFKPLSGAMWRTYLQRFPKERPPITRTQESTRAQQKRKAQHQATREDVLTLFTHAFPGVPFSKSNDVPIPSKVHWHGSLMANNPPSSHLCQQVAWELLEIGFRLELAELDRILAPRDSDNDEFNDSLRQRRVAAVFANGNHIRPSSLPTAHAGLAADNLRDRAPSLEALRRVLCRWPSCPADVVESIPLVDIHDVAKLAAMESRMVRYYVQEFYEASGRAASIPHMFPLTP